MQIVATLSSFARAVRRRLRPPIHTHRRCISPAPRVNGLQRRMQLTMLQQLRTHRLPEQADQLHMRPQVAPMGTIRPCTALRADTQPRLVLPLISLSGTRPHIGRSAVGAVFMGQEQRGQGNGKFMYAVK
jgi:hypothetical protein